MTAKPAQNDAPQGQDITNALKSWVMVVLTLLFVALYGAALTGWLKPLPDEKMITRLEPIIFVIIGYYFGRLPAQQNEQTLKDEITRQTQRADAAQHAKEQVQQVRETLEERVKNAHSVLDPVVQNVSARDLVERLDNADGSSREEALRASMLTALKILNS